MGVVSQFWRASCWIQWFCCACLIQGAAEQFSLGGHWGSTQPLDEHVPFLLLSQGSKASVQSQPADTSSLLQIPKDHFQPVRAQDHVVGQGKPRVSQQVHSPSAERLLRRQVSRVISQTCWAFLLMHFLVNHALDSRRDSQRNLQRTVILLQK